MLPMLPNKDKIKKAQTVAFGGINRQPNAPDGTIWWTANMCSDRMPCLSPRKRRYYIGQYNGCSGIFAYNGLYLVNNKTIYKDGVSIGTAKTNNAKSFTAFNDAVSNTDYIIMYPDKQVINPADDGEASWQNGVLIQNLPVRFYVNEANQNSYFAIRDPNEELRFTELGLRVGDRVTVNLYGGIPLGQAVEILDISARRMEFAPNTFPSSGDYSVTIAMDNPTDVKLIGIDSYFIEEDSHSKIVSFVGWPETAIKAGDTVTISDSSIEANNISALVQDVTGSALVFASGTFTPSPTLHGNPKIDTLTLSKSHTTPVNRVTSMEVTETVTDAVFEDQSSIIQGNTLKSPTTDWSTTGLKAGDAVQIEREGYSYPKMIIREVDGSRLRFDADSFVNSTGDETVTVSRTVPDLDGLFTYEQRVWGWKGSTIYASKWNDPLNFDVFDGLESDSWTYNMDGTGDIIGAITYQGYPTFFKQDKVVRIYGDRPSQYRAMDVTAMGIHPGCGKSLAIAGDTLFYVSRNGLAAYTGGYSKDIHTDFGELRFTKAVAGSDGRRYFLSAYDAKEGWALYVYDTVFGTWFREDVSQVIDFSCDRGNLYWLKGSTYKYLELDGHAPTPPSYANRESEISSEVEFNDFTGNYWTAGRGYVNPSRKGTSKIQLRLTLEAGAALDVSMTFEGGDEILVKQLVAGDGKHSYCLPIIPRRSDNYKIILRGYGDWTLNSLVREEYSGSDIH